MAWHLEELRPAEVLGLHAFELPICMAICPPHPRLAEKVHMIARQEIDMMSKAKVLKPASFSWGFLVLISRRRDGLPRFRVGCRALNKRIKQNIYAVLNSEKVLDGFERLTFFSEMGMFAGY